MASKRNSLAVLLSVIVAVGCGESGRMKVYPVTGRMLVKGKPAVGAQVSFYATDKTLIAEDAPFPRAIVEEDGTFRLTSYDPADGAPAGNYSVTVVWPVANESEDPELRDGNADRLRGRFANAERSPIQIEVREDANELQDIDLAKL